MAVAVCVWLWLCARLPRSTFRKSAVSRYPHHFGSSSHEDGLLPANDYPGPSAYTDGVMKRPPVPSTLFSTADRQQERRKVCAGRCCIVRGGSSVGRHGRRLTSRHGYDDATMCVCVRAILTYSYIYIYMEATMFVYVCVCAISTNT